MIEPDGPRQCDTPEHVVANADGTGSATTTIRTSRWTNYWVMIDTASSFSMPKVEEGQGVPPGISCADLPQKSTNTPFENLPSSGGIPPSALLGISLVLLAASTSSMLLVVRRVA